MYQEPDWKPLASIETLKKRAQLLEHIRNFFKKKNVLEVDTPLICDTATLDPLIKPIQVNYNHKIGYLQTSPEFAMKKMLAANYGCIYQICKAFRDEEYGSLHNPEFTMLEWYRIGFDHFDLMDEIEELLSPYFPKDKFQKFTYKELFEHHLKINPHEVSREELKKISSKFNIPDDLSKDDYLMLLMCEIIEPHLKEPTFIYDFPKTQAALAKIENDVALRFELYINGVELANGYNELTDAKEQRERFLKDASDKSKVDHELLTALEHGMPACSGVALGVDRLLMVIDSIDNINNVLTFR